MLSLQDRLARRRLLSKTGQKQSAREIAGFKNECDVCCKNYSVVFHLSWLAKPIARYIKPKATRGKPISNDVSARKYISIIATPVDKKAMPIMKKAL
jgi:hypothetical protein